MNFSKSWYTYKLVGSASFITWHSKKEGATQFAPYWCLDFLHCFCWWPSGLGQLLNRNENKIQTYMFPQLLQLYLTLYDPMDHRQPGFSVHGILQARILDWTAISFSRENSNLVKVIKLLLVAGGKDLCFIIYESGSLLAIFPNSNINIIGRL